jgi:hypothetical protein
MMCRIILCFLCLQELSRRMTAAMKEAHGKSVVGKLHSAALVSHSTAPPAGA